LNLFQSHIGAIRMRARARYREEGINFNPTLVQLEFILGGESVYQDDEFQSHIGAIRIRQRDYGYIYNRTFQSHIGAIRIAYFRQTLYIVKNNFNPTLVQLEFTAVLAEAAVSGRFQSHIGAIRMSLYMVLNS